MFAFYNFFPSLVTSGELVCLSLRAPAYLLFAISHYLSAEKPAIEIMCKVNVNWLPI